jgi:hypothetical protein
MSLTTPTPLAAPRASTCAPRMTSTLAEKAVSKPKLRSMKWISLSMVLGMATTPIDKPRRSISATSLIAPAQRPVAPDDEEDADAEPLERGHHDLRGS